MPGTERPDGHIYHFLLPDYEMANYSTSGGPGDLAEDEIKAIRSWRRDQRSGYTAADVRTLQRLSTAIDTSVEGTHPPAPAPAPTNHRPPPHLGARGQRQHPPAQHHPAERRPYQQEIASEGVRMSSPYRRLKLVMDYWCALWFWPIDAHDEMPTRDEWLMDLQLILEGDLYDHASGEQGKLFPDTMSRQQALDLRDEHGFVNVDALCERNPRLQRVRALTERYRFLHWELEFAEVFANRQGFDLVLGNPPWVRWSGMRGPACRPSSRSSRCGAGRSGSSRRTVSTLIEKTASGPISQTMKRRRGCKRYLNALQNYPLLHGMQVQTRTSVSRFRAG